MDQLDYHLQAVVSSGWVCWLDISLCWLKPCSFSKSFAADASDTGPIVFNSKKVPDGIFVLCHDDKFGNGVNS